MTNFFIRNIISLNFLHDKKLFISIKNVMGNNYFSYLQMGLQF